MGTKIAEPIIADACPDLPFNTQADSVVCSSHAPAQASSQKQPSAKWRLRPKSVEKMAAIQWKMINSCAEKVVVGGALTYSTCSITVEENEMIIERFLKWAPRIHLSRNKSLKRVTWAARINRMSTALPATSPMQRLLHCKAPKRAKFSHAKVTDFCVFYQVRNRRIGSIVGEAPDK